MSYVFYICATYILFGGKYIYRLLHCWPITKLLNCYPVCQLFYLLTLKGVFISRVKSVPFAIKLSEIKCHDTVTRTNKGNSVASAKWSPFRKHCAGRLADALIARISQRGFSCGTCSGAHLWPISERALKAISNFVLKWTACNCVPLL